MTTRSATRRTVFRSWVTTMLVTGWLLARLQDQLVDHVTHDRIETGRRFVIKHDLRVQGQGPGQSNPLFHSAGKLGRFLRFLSRRQAHFAEPLPDALGNLRFAEPFLLAQAKGDVVEDRHAVEQGGPLKQKAEAQPLLASVRGRADRSGPCLKGDSAGRGPQKPDDQLEHHRFAAAAFADHGQRLPPRNGQVDAGQHTLAAELHADFFQFDQGVRGVKPQGEVLRTLGILPGSVKPPYVKTPGFGVPHPGAWESNIGT